MKTPKGVFKAAYIVEPAAYAGPKDFVMISLLDDFDDERSAVDAAMGRGVKHAVWLDAARTERIG
ncbi:hypothetical protein FHW69_002684 [Luteibacter sp. Sphag1AF]|uniref:hypothetical protein n=1 Tax=Luteibacter sp. Sphag1AF TaxID=2587031 RepID=UPI00161C90E8|nr:hypothetical protein [Luteibacter sp. Sphag1AF]MBB3228049.1 hypothetical protein [Luteibacter sp. Sphag1AF]